MQSEILNQFKGGGDEVNKVSCPKKNRTVESNTLSLTSEDTTIVATGVRNSGLKIANKERVMSQSGDDDIPIIALLNKEMEGSRLKGKGKETHKAKEGDQILFSTKKKKTRRWGKRGLNLCQI